MVHHLRSCWNCNIRVHKIELIGLLMMIDQNITNAERRAKGETGTVLRFVHQIRVAK